MQQRVVLNSAAVRCCVGIAPADLTFADLTFAELTFADLTFAELWHPAGCGTFRVAARL
jgi:uncharacterized protein YjbI with pentapeptide repeats